MGDPLREGDSTRELNKLTQKSQEALQEAQSIASRNGQTETESEHLLLALLTQEGGLIPRLIEGGGVDLTVLLAELQQVIARKPRTTGPGATPGQVFLSKSLAATLDRAERE